MKPLRQLQRRNVRLDMAGSPAIRYERVRSHYTVLDQIERDFATLTGEAAPYIVRDLWTDCNNPDNPLDRKTANSPIRKVIEWCEEQLERMPEYQEMRDNAEGNVVGATLAAKAFVKTLQTLDWPKPPNPDEDTTEQTREGGDGTTETRRVTLNRQTNEVTVTQITETPEGGEGEGGEGEGGEGEGGEGGEGGGGGMTRTVSSSTKACGSAAEAEALAAKVQAQAEKQGYSKPETVEQTFADFEEGVEEMLQDLAAQRGELRQAAKKACADAAEQTEEISDGLRVMRGTGIGNDALENPTDDDLRVVRDLSQSRELRDFVKLIGRFLKMMKQSNRRERAEGTTTPSGIELTGDPTRLLPQELALLNVPSLRAVQIAKIAERRAHGYRMTSLSPKGNGPVHIMLDRSTSMKHTSGGEVKWPVARAFAVAAALFAADNGRAVTFDLFNGGSQIVPCDLTTADGRTAFIKTMLSRIPSGGTSFVAPTLTAKNELNLPPATDVLLISDGEAGWEMQAEENQKIMRDFYGERDLSYVVIGALSDSEPLLRELATPERTVIGMNLLHDERAAELAAESLRAK